MIRILLWQQERHGSRGIRQQQQQMLQQHQNAKGFCAFSSDTRLAGVDVTRTSLIPSSYRNSMGSIICLSGMDRSLLVRPLMQSRCEKKRAQSFWNCVTARLSGNAKKLAQNRGVSTVRNRSIMSSKAYAATMQTKATKAVLR
jgi:hypothetical protein